MSYRSPLGQARGLGSAKHGLHHWWVQRVTALALIPLCLWLVFSIAALGHADHAIVLAWIAQPFNTVLLIAFILALYYHSSLGVQVIIEDYVHSKWLKVSGILLVNFANILLAIIAIVAVLKIAFGAGS
ncbi:MAG: succinate dehydrogenase, hydrophobic membrane anchor protein [Gammaproteobacteria bacterium]|nr:succinate dehydrogenase, hydrophobic membrane anchor protein [Gammaproteobacteria bacterium]